MAGEWELVVDGKWMGVEGENYIDQLAGRWNQAAHVYLEHQEDIELVRYEDFVQEKVATVDGLVSRLGENMRNRIEDKVDQQFQPRGKRRDVDWLLFYGESNLKRIERRCGRAMSAVGYGNYRILDKDRICCK